jgi:myosin heavy subunit
MSADDFSNYRASRKGRLNGGVLFVLFLGLALALAGNVYQFVKAEHLGRDVGQMQRSLQAQITRLSDATSGGFDVTQQRFQNMKELQDSTLVSLAEARSELKRSNSEVADRLEEKNQELAQKNRELMAQLAALKQETSVKLQEASTKLQNASAGLQTTKAKLDNTSAKLDQVSTEIERNRADLKRVASNVSAISVKLPAETKRAVPARQPEERNYLEFDLMKTKVPTRIGEIQIAVRSTDPKKNRYTMDLYTGDQVTQEREGTVNEPVQLYLPGGRIPYEIVVSQVRKDEVVGYVAAPKATAPKLPAATATLEGSALTAPRR